MFPDNYRCAGKEEVDKLKQNWLNDPCFDLAESIKTFDPEFDTIDYSKYYQVLKEFEDQTKLQWEENLKIPGNEQTKKFYSLKLHESMTVTTGSSAMRVPGGWIYHMLADEPTENYERQYRFVFVPYNGEFNPFIKTSIGIGK